MRSNVALRAVMGLTVVGALVVAGGAAVSAAVATEDLGVAAIVSVKCTITTAPVAFGEYDPVETHAALDLDGTGTVSIACTKGSTVQIGLDLGSNPAGSVRQMTAGGIDRLTYELYSDAYTTVWGDVAGSWLEPVAAPSKAARPFTVYGRVSANQDVAAGTYTDTVEATVNF